MSVLSLNNICFSYDRTPVLQNISYDFEEGKVYCISGKSGAGKTTLLSVLSGLAEPNSGSICYDGNDIIFAGKAGIIPYFSHCIFRCRARA